MVEFHFQWRKDTCEQRFTNQLDTSTMPSFNLTLRKTKTADWPPASVQHNGRLHNLADVFRDVGIDLRFTADPEPIGDHPRGLSFDLVDLHGLLPKRHSLVASDEWQATALVVPSIAYLSGQRVRRPQGVMFDVGAADGSHRAREGCALAWQSIGGHPAIYLRTLAHEVGHLLNLRHPEEDTPPMYNGSTLMFETRSLARSRTYPNNIQFEFSDANVDWLRTAPVNYVRPGGEPYGSRPGRNVKATMPPTDSAFVESAQTKSTDPLELSLHLAASHTLPWHPIEFEVCLSATGTMRQHVAIDLDPAGGELSIDAMTADLWWQTVPAVVRDCGNPRENLPSSGQLKQLVMLPGACLHGLEGRTFRARYRCRLADGQHVDICSPPIIVEAARPRCKAERLASEACTSFDVRLAVCWGGFSARLDCARQRLEAVNQQINLASVAPRLALALAHSRVQAARSADDVRELRRLMGKIRRARAPNHNQFEAEFIDHCCLNGSSYQTTVR
jgi:hypothetical protein